MELSEVTLSISFAGESCCGKVLTLLEFLCLLNFTTKFFAVVLSSASVASLLGEPLREQSMVNSMTLQLYQVHRWVFSGLIALFSFLFGHYVHPYCRPFFVGDPTISYDFAEQETFPSWTLAPIVLCPIAAYAAVIFFTERKTFLVQARGVTPRQQLLLELNAWALVQLQALMFHLMFVETFKLYAGRLRPDFLSRLAREGIVVSGSGPQYFCSADILDNAILRDGRLSFPSGHSSTSFGAMVPLCFFFAQHLRPFFHGCVIRLVVTISPLYLGFFVAVSRTRDNRHNFSDVLAGSLIGVAAGIAAVVINFRYSKLSGEFQSREDRMEGGIESPSLPAVQMSTLGQQNV